MIRVSDATLDGLKFVETRIHRDDRGQFQELWRDSYSGLLGCRPFVQDNASWSRKGVIRGLHFQDPHPQGKLVCVLHGSIFDVAVDLRRDSDTYGQWEGIELRDDDGKQLYVPEGFAHGFAVMSESALVYYKCTDYYRPECSQTLRWDDRRLGIVWPVDTPVLSEQDRAGLLLETIEQGR